MRIPRMTLLAAIPIILALMIHGCTLTQTAGERLLALKQNVKGNYYLENKKYREGIEAFNKEVEVNPDNAETHYYLGRFQLATDNYDAALNHLKRAVRLSPDEADYYFWLGVAYGVKKEAARERQCYLRVLEIDENHLAAMTYLGHNHFEQKEFAEALKIYQEVLDRQPENPGALFNRALILKHYGGTSEEKSAWHTYLRYYPEGPLARRAVGNLNELGDFAYRNYLIGSRTVTLKTISFEPFSSEIRTDSYPSLAVLGEILENNRKVPIHIVAYQRKNEKLARKRAKNIKEYLLQHFPEISPARLKLSWFGVSEKITSGNSVFKEDESINFITVVETMKNASSASNKRSALGTHERGI